MALLFVTEVELRTFGTLPWSVSLGCGRCGVVVEVILWLCDVLWATVGTCVGCSEVDRLASRTCPSW